MKLQSVLRGHFGRHLFRKRCREQQQQLLREFEWVNSPSPGDTQRESDGDSEDQSDDDFESGSGGDMEPRLDGAVAHCNTATLRKIVMLQAAMRGRLGRRLFQARCFEATQELLDDDVVS